MSKQTCKTCKFWDELKGSKYGDCKRHPQKILKETTDWCGEYEKTKGAKTAVHAY